MTASPNHGGAKRCLLVLLFVAACAAPAPPDAPPDVLSFAALPAPAAPGSGRPGLHVDADRIFLSWTEPAADGGVDGVHALRYAVLDGDAWSAPRTVAAGEDWFVNWADVPALVADGEHLAAHYLAMEGDGPYAYGVRLVRSADGGARWRPPVTPHRDGTPTEHGFVSLLPLDAGRVGAVWLDGRETGGGHGHGGPMTLRYAEVDTAGTLHAEAVLDARVCDCCATAAVGVPGGLAVFYRDRSPDEVRDVSVVRRVDGRWTAPAPVSREAWTIEGCPVNGPAAAARGADVAVAYFTAAADSARVLLARSADGAATFAPPLRVDDGRPLGRTDVALLADGRALVTWLEATDGGAEVRARFVDADGTAAPSFLVTPTSAARASGFPRLAATADRVVVAWTEPGPDGAPSLLRTAEAPLGE